MIPNVVVFGFRKLSLAPLISLGGLSSGMVILPGDRLKFSTRSVLSVVISFVVSVCFTGWGNWPHAQPGGSGTIFVWPFALDLSGLV